MNRSSLLRRARRLLAAAVVVVAVVGPPDPAAAYEYQVGNSSNCPRPPWNGVRLWMSGYGDSNLYSSYGLEAFAYGVPFNSLISLQRNTSHTSSGSAGEAENYVVAVGSYCY